MAELPSPNGGQVKQETNEGGGGGGTIVVVGAEAADDASRVDITIRFDMTLLHYHVCVLPLKPPVFKCDAAGHVACASCHGNGKLVPGDRCHAYRGVYDRCLTMDAVVGAARVPCPYGCGSFVAYHELGSHQGVCPCAPCSCTEPGCGFAGPPAALLGHFTAKHSWPVRGVRYGKVVRLHLPASEPPRLLLVEEEGDDGRAFLLSVYAPDLACRAVSLVCVRANAAAEGPPYTCKLWADAPRDATNSVSSGYSRQ